MTRTVSASQANREFSKLLRAVTSGERVVVTSRGKPVAQIVAIDGETGEAQRRQAAFDELTNWLADRPILNLPRVTRDEMYE
jgi:prevent-host-death family protein